MPSTFKVLITSFFLLLLFSCTNRDTQQENSAPEVMLLECKPIQWPDGSTSYSVYAIIGTNQTKVANAKSCEPVDPAQIPGLFPSKDILSLLDCKEGENSLFFFLEKTGDGLKVVQSEGSDSTELIVTTFKNGKFFFN